jgi:hypothetical protein
LEEARVFFGTLEHKDAFDANTTPEYRLERARQKEKLDEYWIIDKVFPGTPSSPPTIVAKRNEPKPVRQCLPVDISEFIADQVERGTRINTHRIKCEGGESPAEQIALITRAFQRAMDISEWQLESDGVVHIQCRRVAFIGIQLKLGDVVYEAWEQAGANTRHREKLASILFQKRVSFKKQHILFDEGETIVDEMVPFADRYVKPKDTRIKDRQMTFPGAPPRWETSPYYELSGEVSLRLVTTGEFLSATALNIASSASNIAIILNGMRSTSSV